MRLMPARALALLALLLASSAHAQVPGVAPVGPNAPAESKEALRRQREKEEKERDRVKPKALRRPDLRTVSGEISALAWQDRRFTVDGADGPVTVRVDRNTLVFLDEHLGTMRDLAVGTLVRANIGGSENLASWIEVRPRPPAGKEPGAGGSGPAEARGASDAGGPGTAGTVAPGADAGAGGAGGTTGTGGGEGSPPSPTPITPPTAPAPGSPAGPGPVPGGSGTGR